MQKAAAEGMELITTWILATYLRRQLVSEALQ